MLKKPTADEIIKRYKLIKHIEGGYYYRGYTSKDIISAQDLPKRFGGDRPLATAIYYLIPGKVISKLHRLKADEIWHFYLGDQFTLIEISEKGNLKKTILGQDILNNQEVQYVVPNNTWFGGFVNEPGEYSFVGCQPAPGFDEKDFELCEERFFINHFPSLKEEILPIFF